MVPMLENPKIKTLIERVKNIIMDPQSEWIKIEAEQTTIITLFKEYILILAAIPAVCGFIGTVLFGYRFYGYSRANWLF